MRNHTVLLIIMIGFFSNLKAFGEVRCENLFWNVKEMGQLYIDWSQNIDNRVQLQKSWKNCCTNPKNLNFGYRLLVQGLDANTNIDNLTSDLLSLNEGNYHLLNYISELKSHTTFDQSVGLIYDVPIDHLIASNPSSLETYSNLSPIEKYTEFGLHSPVQLLKDTERDFWNEVLVMKSKLNDDHTVTQIKASGIFLFERRCTSEERKFAEELAEKMSLPIYILDSNYSRDFEIEKEYQLPQKLVTYVYSDLYNKSGKKRAIEFYKRYNINIEFMDYAPTNERLIKVQPVRNSDGKLIPRRSLKGQHWLTRLATELERQGGYSIGMTTDGRAFFSEKEKLIAIPWGAVKSHKMSPTTVHEWLHYMIFQDMKKAEVIIAKSLQDDSQDIETNLKSIHPRPMRIRVEHSNQILESKWPKYLKSHYAVTRTMEEGYNRIIQAKIGLKRARQALARLSIQTKDVNKLEKLFSTHLDYSERKLIDAEILIQSNIEDLMFFNSKINDDYSNLYLTLENDYLKIRTRNLESIRISVSVAQLRINNIFMPVTDPIFLGQVFLSEINEQKNYLEEVRELMDEKNALINEFKSKLTF